MSDRFLFTTITLADEDQFEYLKSNLGREPLDHEIELSFAEIVIDLAEVEAVRQSFKGASRIPGETCVYLLGDLFYIHTPYDEVLRAWLAVKDDQVAQAPSLDVGRAVATLAQALDQDRGEGSLYYGYQSNIAEAFQNAFYTKFGRLAGHQTAWPGPITPNDLREISNLGARDFLNMLIKSIK
jgi:hypothetical protein